MEKKETNRIYWILAAAVIAISIIATGMAFSLSPQMESSGTIPGPSISPRQLPMPPIPYGVKLLLHVQELNVLSQLTGKSVDIIKKEQTRCKPLPEFLDENGITPELFRTVMDEQAMKLVKQASATNIITKDQAEEIIDMINKQAAYLEANKGKRRIENGP